MREGPAPAVRVGTVQLLRRFPLRSADGERPARLALGAAGVDGDRRWALVAEDGTVLGGRDVPPLAAVTARLVDGYLVLEVAGRVVQGDVREEVLCALLGRRVRLRDTGAGGDGPHRAGAAVHLVSAGAAEAPDAPSGCDPGERANLVLSLDAAAPGAERGWAGRLLAVGSAELALTRTPRACLGVYADVVRPGVVAVGDAVVLGVGAP